MSVSLYQRSYCDEAIEVRRCLPHYVVPILDSDLLQARPDDVTRFIFSNGDRCTFIRLRQQGHEVTLSAFMFEELIAQYIALTLRSPASRSMRSSSVIFDQYDSYEDALNETATQLTVNLNIASLGLTFPPSILTYRLAINLVKYLLNSSRYDTSSFVFITIVE